MKTLAKEIRKAAKNLDIRISKTAARAMAAAINNNEEDICITTHQSLAAAIRQSWQGGYDCGRKDAKVDLLDDIIQLVDDL